MVEQREATGRSGDTEPLERRDMILYRGDWEELQELLAGTRIKPTTFIRMLVRRTIRRIQAAKAGVERPVEGIDERLVSDIERANTELPIAGGNPDELGSNLV